LGRNARQAVGRVAGCGHHRQRHRAGDGYGSDDANRKARKKGWLVTLGTVVVLVAAMGAPPSSASAWPTTKTTAGLGVSVALHEDAAFVIDAVHPGPLRWQRPLQRLTAVGDQGVARDE
jgi:hypothetical protein